MPQRNAINQPQIALFRILRLALHLLPHCIEFIKSRPIRKKLLQLLPICCGFLGSEALKRCNICAELLRDIMQDPRKLCNASGILAAFIQSKRNAPGIVYAFALLSGFSICHCCAHPFKGSREIHCKQRRFVMR
jgi:hypothetical protein